MRRCLPHRWDGPAGVDHFAGTGRVRTTCGHQNQRPISAAIDGVMNDRTISVSNSSPSAMVLPTCAITVRSPNTNDTIVARTPDRPTSPPTRNRPSRG